jgi:hypothetical protein
MSAKTFARRCASQLAIGAFAATAVGGDCDGDIVQDPTFRDWCGDALCAWKLDEGHLQRVPTWNENDFGVGFVDDPTQISQSTTESSATCILFTSVANLDPAADVTLSVDFNGDGTIEYASQLGATRWQKVQTEITAPAAYQGITFILKKGGTGTAVLAEMRIQSSTGCTAAAAAVAPGSLVLGEKCGGDGDCRAGLTCTGAASDLLCSQCSSTVACADGAACSARSVFLPSQCGPGDGLGAAGDPCLAASDCASGACDGATPVALADDAGACDLDAAMGSADPANCQWYAARGGQCR